MSKPTDKSLFMDSSLRRFYQQLLSGIVSYRELGNRVIRQIKAAHAFRQVERVGELSNLLLNIPIKEYQLIGQYYLYWCRYRNHECDIASLEAIIDHTRTYKAQALLSRGTLEYDHRRHQEAFYFYAEALKARPNVSEYIAISRAIAVAKATDGFHKLALTDMEKLLPIIKHAEPRLYYDFLNSYAVELGEAGRKQEARNISRFVLASPFAHAYPEWQETANDLMGINRSFVAFNRTPYLSRTVLPMPVVEYVESVVKLDKPARVFELEKWKKKMAKGRKKNGDKKPYDEMDEREMFLEIMQLYASDDTTDEQRRRIFNAVVGILSEPDKPEPDDEGA